MTQPTNPAPPATEPAAPAPTPPTPAPPAAPAAPAMPEWDGKIESLPEAAQKIIADARAEAGKARTSAKEQAAADARQELLKQLGLVTDDEDPVKALEQERQQSAGKDTTITDLRRDNALLQALHATAAKPIARAAILGDRILDGLDHTAADFAAQVKAKVDEYLGNNPELVGGQAPPPTSGIPSTGGPGPSADIDAQIKEAQDKGDHRRAIALRRQKAYAPGR